MADRIALGRGQKVFIAEETTVGTMVKPTGTIMSIAGSFPQQDREKLLDEQRRGSRSRLAQLVARYTPGNWALQTYIKPSGTKGTAPEVDVLCKCATGTKTVNAGTSVVYTLAENLVSCSLMIVQDHTAFYMIGCGVNQMETNIAGSEEGNISWSGQCMKQMFAGTANITGIHALGATSVVLHSGEAKRYWLAGGALGPYINVGTSTNAGAGHQITNVNYATDTLTINPGLSSEQADDAEVVPWTPTVAELGTPVHGKLGTATKDAASFNILRCRIMINNNQKFQIDEKNGTLYASGFVAPVFREVSGSVEIYLRQEAVRHLYESIQNTQIALIVPAGDTQGYIFEASLPKVELNALSRAGDEEIVQTMNYLAVASSSLNDEVTLTWK